ncbi:MAG: hypothetical protein HRT35_25045 [Algicola sp.]|nr:hypothetical protein [Algicola sp.]
MYSAFKQTHLLGVLLCGLAMPALGIDCATVVFTPAQINGQTHNLSLISDNGVTIKQGTGTARQHRLSPGWHTLTIEQQASGTSITKPVTKTLRIAVEVDKKYILSLNKTGKKMALLSSETFLCSKPEHVMAQAKLAIGQSTIPSNEQLPPRLEYRLRRLMAKIETHHRGLTNTEKANLVPLTRVSRFGVIFDHTHSANDKALQILAVSPFSQATRLGLASGDAIIALGESPINLKDRKNRQKNPNNDSNSNAQNYADKALQNYLGPMTSGQTITVKVIRNGNTITLQGTFKPVIVPEVYYQLEQSTNTFVKTEQ